MTTKASVNVLLVDDLPENLLALKATLESEDVRIFTATSGTTALELLLEHSFAVALIDVQMPIMGGFELAELMRSTSRTRSIPIILVTAETRDRARSFKGYEAGAVDILYKPLDPHVVRTKVRVFAELALQRQELSELAADLKEALRVREEFLSICSHELKTPLTSMQLQTQLAKRELAARKDFPPEKFEKYLDQAEKHVKRVNRLVDDMLDISRIQTGRFSMQMEMRDLSELVREVTESFAPQFLAAACEVKITLEAGLRASIDPQRIEQVILNLYGNILKYAPGKPVEVALRKEGALARLTVKDYGPGIDPDALDRIFERFERLVSANEVSGLGLGLYIVQKIVRSHHGRIWANSRPGDGSTFHVELPLAL